jgi:K+-sensing histidine kinase KdpD
VKPTTLKYQIRLSSLEVESIIDRIVAESNQLNIHKRFLKITINCLVELIDNAFRYSSSVSEVLVEVELSADQVAFVVMNQSTLSDVEVLMLQVESYKRMSDEELDLLYRQKLSNNTFNERGGAGLGLLQIMRKDCLKEIVISPKLGTASNVYCRVDLKLKKCHRDE